MSTIFFPKKSGMSDIIINPFQFKDIGISKKINEAVSRVTFGVKSILDMHGNCVLSEITSQFGDRDEGEIRELLKNYQNTFPIFQKSLLKAKDECKKGKKVSVEIYIHDLNNEEILKTMRELKESGINTNLLVIDIKKDDYGILNSVTIRHLRYISSLGFGFSIDDFSLGENHLTAPNLEKLVQENIYPKYIKIAKNIYESIINNTIKFSQGIVNLLWIIKKKGIKLLANNTNETSEKQDPTIREIPEFLNTASIKNEDILSLDGDLYAQEGLISFGDGVSTVDGLKILKENNLTGELMRLMLKHATNKVMEGKKRSINIYLKDLGELNFIKNIEEICFSIPIFLRKNLIFEILEDTYGSINNQVIKNIKLLQTLGFSIAIDDLYLGCDKNSMSKEILETIHEEGIIANYLKIDGRHSMGIKDGTISPNELRYLREIVGQFSKLDTPPLFIVEWIQDTEHAEYLARILDVPGVNFLFQGRNISSGSFGAQNTMRVLSLESK